MGHQDLVDAVVQNLALLLGVVVVQELGGDLLLFLELQGIFAGSWPVCIFVLNNSHDPFINVLEDVVIQIADQVLASDKVGFINVELAILIDLETVTEVLVDDRSIEFTEVFELREDQVFLVFAIEQLQQVGLVLGDLHDGLVQVSFLVTISCRQGGKGNR